MIKERMKRFVEIKLKEKNIKMEEEQKGKTLAAMGVTDVSKSKRSRLT